VAEDDESTEPRADELAQERERADRRLLGELAAAREPGRENEAAERDAIAKLIGSYDDYVGRVVWLRIYDGHEREDVAQGVRLRLARTLFRQSTFNVPFFAVVRRSLNNELVDYFRRHGRRREDTTGELPRIAAGAHNDPAERLDALGDRRLRDALALLSQGDRDLLGAKFLLGLGGPQIANQFGMTESNTNVRVHRALRKLRGILRGDVTNQADETE
jgi:RNA polymerase sigma factor (sigma-70 family)